MKILIVGAGPTGLFLACKLHQYQLSPTIIDRLTKPSDLRKSVGISNASLSLFSTLGLKRRFLDNAKLLENIQIYCDKKRVSKINMKLLPIPGDKKFILLDQIQTEKLLTEKLEKYGGKIIRDAECVDIKKSIDNVKVKIRERSFIYEKNFDYVIACDGAQSKIRKAIAASTVQDNYQSYFILVDACCNLNYRQEIGYFLTSNGYFMIVPLGMNCYRLIASFSGKFKDLPNFNENHFLNVMKNRTGLKATIKKILWWTSGPLRYQYAKKPNVGQIFLAGDALHTFSPIGGTTMNMGLQDAQNLAWKLAYVNKKLVSKNLLHTYSSERLFSTKHLIQISSAVTLSMTQVEKIPPFTQNNFSPLAANRKWLRYTLPKILSGYNQYYKNSSLKLGNNQLKYFVGDINEWILKKDIDYLKHYLIIFHKEELKNFCFLKFIPNWVEIVYYNADNISLEFKTLIKLLEIKLDLSIYFLVRPDGYLVAIDNLSNISQLASYFKEIGRE
jgi:2-polyprenyl-6-methoxyphenol hydroxylase-like FAD-dependent oxidoreductase